MWFRVKTREFSQSKNSDSQAKLIGKTNTCNGSKITRQIERTNTVKPKKEEITIEEDEEDDLDD